MLDQNLVLLGLRKSLRRLVDGMSSQPRILRRLSASWVRIPISYRGVLVIALPTLCTLITLGFWIGLRERAQSLNVQIERGNIQVRASDDLLTMLLNAETGVRGYALVPEAKFLEPYQSAQQKLPDTLKQFSQSQSGPELDREVASIQRRVPLRLQNLTDQIAASQSAALDRTKANQLLNQGKALMDAIRQDLNTVKTIQSQNLNREMATVAQVRSLAGVVQQVMVVVSLLAFVAAFYLFRQLDIELGDRKRQLYQSQTLIDAITSNVVDGVLTLNQHGKIQTINAAVTKLFQYKSIDLLGQHVTKLWFNPARQSKTVSAPFMEELLLGHSWQTIAYRQDGSGFPVELSISETQLKKQFIVFVRDMTERVKAETQLKTQSDQLAKLNLTLIQSNTELERQNKELETITYIAAHDLKTPLRGIATLSEWIEEDLGPNLPSTAQEQLGLLRSRVYRLTALINELLDYSRIGRDKNVIETVVVQDLLQKIIDSLQPHNIDITIGAGMPTFATDKDLLQEVFFQLIENSILHHDLTAGTIFITVQERLKEYEFTVTDDGPGIASEFYEKVFAAFQMLDRRNNDTQQTGIGLAKVKKIVETSGGMVWLETEGDRGLAVHFTWAKSYTKWPIAFRNA
jgi:PAS domain S-box-containing protein